MFNYRMEWSYIVWMEFVGYDYVYASFFRLGDTLCIYFLVKLAPKVVSD